ncbi:hypothetical protein FG379_001839 [Cryptosporidium bovis]|uniref:uncharacterized protein n=1 Tax=Cryptosporidium bovis TaxID=310047 RepID=UPI003519ECD7|nr:hypothetical protein FG379_001839 [Cryptosporidium bovis]
MTKIRYIFLDKLLWDPIKRYIQNNNSSVNSLTELKQFVGGISQTTSNREIKDSTRKISDSISSSLPVEKDGIITEFFTNTFKVLSNLLVNIDKHLTVNKLPERIIEPKTNSVMLFQRKFIASIMFGAFLGLFPGQIFNSKTPGLCFQNFFGTSSASKHQVIAFMSYFNDVAIGISSNHEFVEQQVIFERHYSAPKDTLFFINSNEAIQPTELVRGFMENYNPGGHVVEAIFGNKIVGSATLSNVMHQEEIMMTTSPETLFARIFHTNMGQEDSLSFRGLLKYSSYKGYGTNNYRHIDVTSQERFRALGRIYTSFDAIPGNQGYTQFTTPYSLRELNKLVPGLCTDFYGETEVKQRSPFVGGYWGGGVFGGDIKYKFIIQMIASCVCRRALAYADPDKHLNLQEIRRLEQKYTTCGRLAKALFDAERAGRISKGNAINVLLS